jgi:hypothetical protein
MRREPVSARPWKIVTAVAAAGAVIALGRKLAADRRAGESD